MDNTTVFGIDLGTTHSCIAYVDEASGRPSVVTNKEGDLTTPSVVLFEDTNRVVGKEAKNGAVMYSERVVAMVKRQMGVPGWRFSYEDKEYTAEEISSYILRRLVEDAEEALGVAPKRVVITCPAYFGSAEREATAKAGEIAGLDVLRVINEPTAAAISYGVHAEGDQTVLVYDLGGGTFDVTMMEIEGGSVSVIATDGDHRLGGRDWDEAILGYLAEQWQQGSGSSDDPRNSEESLQDLWQRAEDGKRSLSARTEARITVSHDGVRVPVTLTRDKFDELTAHHLELTVEFTKAVLRFGEEQGKSTFDTLLLVGGSSKMPQVAARLTKEFGVTPVLHDPDQSVAKGAAIYGHKLALDELIEIETAKLLKDRGLDESDLDNAPSDVRQEAIDNVSAETGIQAEHLTKTVNMTVSNVASHSFGIVAMDDSDGTRKEYISNLVFAQDKIPASETRTYGTVVANQTHVDLRIMENTQRDVYTPMELGRSIGLATLTLSRGLPAESPVDVTFELTADGRLKVTGRDLADQGKEIVAIIKTDNVLSDEELRQAMERSKGLKVTG